jgi:hypothetical protein
MRSYQVTVHTAEGRNCYITKAQSDSAAVSDTLGFYPAARGISAKPVTTTVIG